MDYKEIFLGVEAKKLLKTGINRLAEVVLLTMGPEGRTVIIPDENANPKVTKDGVSVAKAVAFQDTIQNIGATLIKEVAQKTVKEAGDGTTTAICLANAFINKGFELIDSGGNPNSIKAYLEQLESLSLKWLDDVVYPIKEGDIKHVATIAANNDKNIGSIIEEAFNHSNVVRVDKGYKSNHTINKIEGMEFRSGILDQAFINDPASQAIAYGEARLLVVEGHLNSLKPVATEIQKLDTDEVLIIIADEVSDSVTRILRDNYNKGALKVGIIKSPGHAQHRINLIGDIKLACGVKEGKLGYIKSIKATTDKTIIEYERTSAVEERLRDLKILYNKTYEEYEQELLQQRMDLLEGNVAVIQVGGNSDIEIGEAYDRIEDAVLATKCAIEEGVIEGAGYALRCSVGTIEPNPFAICLRAPFDQIITNGHNDMKIKNYYDEGIIDPVKVTKVALKNAISVAKTVLGVEAIVQ
jgi:chaperonin GroEL|tara:strand:- start:18086 stop:19492 length:1407 start_codon:yes stop_codon:yes gene_type:complete